MRSIKYLLTSGTYEIQNFIRYLAVPIILFPLKSVEAGKMSSYLKIVKRKLIKLMFQEFLNVLVRIRHHSNSFDKIKGPFKIEANFHLSIFIIKV